MIKMEGDLMKTVKNINTYQHYFKDYPVFDLFVKHSFTHGNPKLFVDQEEDPQTIVLYEKPAYMLFGKPTKDIEVIIEPSSWFISPNQSWDALLEELYKEHIDGYPRVLLDEQTIDVNQLKAYQKTLPPELKIVPIEEKHLREGMIKEDVLDRFFQGNDFMKTGFGFALVNEKEVIHGFALTNYPILSKDIEVYYRVGYDNFQTYRHQGIGTTLAAMFVEEATKRGYHPIWDAATPLSLHIAKKLGYTEKYHWKMYHLKSNI